MPFIVYFFLSLLIIYIPTPTLLLFFQKLASQHDNLQGQKSALPLFSFCQCLRMADPLLSLFTI
jgi:hypothetical protein